jgi:hypothetical protein
LRIPKRSSKLIFQKVSNFHHYYHHHHHHRAATMELGHLLTHSGRTHAEVCSMVSSVFLVYSSYILFSNLLRCILFTCPIQFLTYSCILLKLELLIHLKFLYLFCSCPSVSCSFVYFISAAVILLASNFKIGHLDNRSLGKTNKTR